MSLRQLTAEGPTVVNRAEVWREGALLDVVPILSGEVTYDTDRRIRRTCTLTLRHLPGPHAIDPLTPGTNSVRLFRGARDWTGQEFMEPVGVYVYDETDTVMAAGETSLSGSDLAQLVADARWEEPYAIAQGTPLADAIADAVKSRLPDHLWQEPNIATVGNLTTPVVWGEERDNDPWADVVTLAEAYGQLLSLDRSGRLTMTPQPHPDDTAVVADLTVGESRLIETVGLTRHGRPYNIAVATGETDDDAPPVVGRAEDDDPTSASYVGHYRKPVFLTSGYIATQAQADQAAQAELARRVGLSETVPLGLAAMPWVDVWEAVDITAPALSLDGRYVLSSYRMPLGPGMATAVTRRRRFVDA